MARTSHIHPSDLLGLSRLAADATVGLSAVVEALHDNVARGPGAFDTPSSGPTTGITGLVYQSIRSVAGLAGVGIAAIQMASRAGARVLATASSDEKLSRLAALGLDDGINYATTDFADEVRRLTEGRGADVIVDSVGGPTLQGSLRCLAYRGRCVTVGDAGRRAGEQLDISTLRPNNQSLIGVFLGAELFLNPRTHAMIARHLDEIASGSLQVVIDRRFPLSEAAQAHAYIESRQAFGRVLLVP